jgi:hypothetical protein
VQDLIAKREALVLVKVKRYKKRHAASSSSRGILYYSVYSKLEHNK